VEIVFAVCF